MKIGNSVERARIKILLAIFHWMTLRYKIWSHPSYHVQKYQSLWCTKHLSLLSVAINQGLKTKIIQLLGYAIPAPCPSQKKLVTQTWSTGFIQSFWQYFWLQYSLKTFWFLNFLRAPRLLFLNISLKTGFL